MDQPSQFDLTARALDDLATLAGQHIAHVDGAAVTLLEPDGPQLGASNELARTVDVVQYGCGEGPCISAAELGVPVTSGRIGTGETRWPRFVAGTASTGLRSVLSFPLHGPERVEGSLNLYSRARHAFDAVAILQAEMFLQPLAVALRDARVMSSVGEVAGSWTLLLGDRAAVDLALGVLSASEGLTIDAARRRLDALAHAGSCSWSEAGRALVLRTSSAPPGTGLAG